MSDWNQFEIDTLLMKKLTLNDIYHDDVEEFDPEKYMKSLGPKVTRGAQDSKEWLFEHPSLDWRETPGVVSSVKR